jgi:hypothetical protein
MLLFYYFIILLFYYFIILLFYYFIILLFLIINQSLLWSTYFILWRKKYIERLKKYKKYVQLIEKKNKK